MMCDMDSQPLMVFKSNVPGKSASVTIYPDRLEWSREGKLAKLQREDGTEMMPIRSITSVTSKRDGFAAKLTVIAAGNTIEFRQDRATIDQAKSLLTQLATGGHPAQRGDTPAATASSLADELLKLKQLVDAGAITPAEYELAKGHLLD